MADLKSSLATAATVLALATWPVYGAEKAPTAKSENVTAQTRKKVTQLKLEFPNFKLSNDAQQCVDGKLIDPECEPTINAEVDVYAKRQQVNAERQQVNAERQQVNAERKNIEIMNSARDNISIVIWLVQLWLYVDYEKIPPKDADYMDIVMSNPNTPKDVQSLFVDFLKRKKSGWTFSWKADGERLINLANKHLQIANTLQWQLTNEIFKKQASAMYSQAASSYTMAREMLAKKA